MKLKLMTYNVASGRTYHTYAADKQAPVDIRECAAVIKKLEPTFCGLNEVNVYDKIDNQPREIAELAGFGYSFFSKTLDLPPSREYGNGFICRHPIASVETVKIPDPERTVAGAPYESRAIAKIELDLAGGITVLQTHFGLMDAEKSNAVRTLCELIDSIKAPTVLMGDFNIMPDDRLHECLRERLVDCAEVCENPPPTFPSYGTERHKIDYIYVSRHFRIHAFEALSTTASDHLPVYAEVEL